MTRTFIRVHLTARGATPVTYWVETHAEASEVIELWMCRHGEAAAHVKEYEVTT